MKDEISYEYGKRDFSSPQSDDELTSCVFYEFSEVETSRDEFSQEKLEAVESKKFLG